MRRGATRAPVRTTIVAHGDLRAVHEEARATCSEALANVACRSRVTQAMVTVAVESGTLTIEIADGGEGGALLRQFAAWLKEVYTPSTAPIPAPHRT